MELFKDYELVKVTPQMAQAWLDAMPPNRKHRPSATDHYRDLYRTGRWIASPSMPLMFNADGMMIDGQHRCKGIVEHGEPVWMCIRRNVTEEEMVAIHDTLPRSIADQISITKHVNQHDSRTISSIGFTLLSRLRAGRLTLTKTKNERYSIDDIYLAFEKIGQDPQDIATRADVIYDLQPRGLRIFSPTEIGYALLQDPPEIEDWLRRLVSDGGSKSQGMLAARTYKANSKMFNRLRNAGHLAIAKAWNLPNISKISYRKTENVTPFVPDLSGGCFERKEAGE